MQRCGAFMLQTILPSAGELVALASGPYMMRVHRRCGGEHPARVALKSTLPTGAMHEH
jgi:hypothetical protein